MLQVTVPEVMYLTYIEVLPFNKAISQKLIYWVFISIGKHNNKNQSHERKNININYIILISQPLGAQA